MERFTEGVEPLRPMRRFLVLLAILAVAGCTATRTSVTPAPSAVPSTSAALPPTPDAGVPTGPGVGDGSFSAAMDAAMAELMAAIGNPDTGAPSDASKAFDEALERADRTAISASAQVILDHLDKGRRLVASFAGSPAGAIAVYELDRMLAGIAQGITAMRDGGLAGDASAVQAGRMRMQEALLDHFYQLVYGPSAERFRVTMPDGRVVSPSRARLTMPADSAFDGNPQTFWLAGESEPPQWIEVDLGFDATITGVRLLTAQGVGGETSHVVTIRSATGSAQEFARFSGSTVDNQWLEYAAPTPVADVRLVRVTTDATPSMIGWREIEVLLAPGSHPEPCPSGGDNLAAGSSVNAPLELAGHAGSLAVDGDPKTFWDSGQVLDTVIIVNLGRQALVSEVRLLAAHSTDGPARIEVSGSGNVGRRTLGTVDAATTDGTWLSIPGPAPCVSIDTIVVRTMSSPSSVAWREIEVLGTAAP